MVGDFQRSCEIRLLRILWNATSWHYTDSLHIFITQTRIARQIGVSPCGIHRLSSGFAHTSGLIPTVTQTNLVLDVHVAPRHLKNRYQRTYSLNKIKNHQRCTATSMSSSDRP